MAERNRGPVDDFTLIIPTYERPVELGRLLAYLADAGCSYPISVLDSSREQMAARNRDTVARAGLAASYSRYDERTDPFDKFAQGVGRVETRYAALCPDDDIPFLPGIDAGLAMLRQDPGLGLAHGWSLLFRDDEEGRLELSAIVHKGGGIDDADPMRRLHRLVRRYQAPTYGVYRTALLHECLDRARRQESLLWREHMASALAAARARIGAVDTFVMARRAGGHAARRQWHPVEWLIGAPSGLAAGFSSFAEALADAIAIGQKDGRPKADIRELIHLIYADYFAQQVPQPLFDPVIEARLNGVPPERIFVSGSVTGPIIDAHMRLQTGLAPADAKPDELLLRSPVRDYVCRWPFVAVLRQLPVGDRDAALRRLADMLDRWHLAAARWEGEAAARR